jgi:uncharacterized protein YlxW (UPF0749 family)
MPYVFKFGRFGQETEYRPHVAFTTQKLNRLVTFTFKYRSLDILKANGLVAAEPKSQVGKKRRAADSPAVKEEGGSDLAELNHLQEKIKKIQERIATGSSNKRIKVESTQHVSRRGEVIDLTLD